MKHYCSYMNMMVCYDTDAHSFRITKENRCLFDATLDGLMQDGTLAQPISLYTDSTAERTIGEAENKLLLKLSAKDALLPPLDLEFVANADSIVFSPSGMLAYTLSISGTLPETSFPDCFAVCTNRDTEDLRSAYGPAASTVDNAVYNRKTDRAVTAEDCHNFRLRYDFDASVYRFRILASNAGYVEKIVLTERENLLADRFHIPFVPMKKRGGYTTPPVGWMTWYAVKFDACEDAVLRNLEFQKKHLKPFGANTLWVDWEWCHRRWEPTRDDGTDVFHPDPKKYPHGLKYISDAIRKAGFTPALWIGFTNDLSDNEFTQKHPEIILAKFDGWCGSYFYDFSHPTYINEFLPSVISNMQSWGFDTVKFDTLPIAIDKHEEFHDSMYRSEMSTYAAYRGMIKKARELLGDDTYMLSCSGEKDADVLWGADIFDSARVGRDVFTWDEFVHECVDKINRYYPLHNIMLYPDPDNVVLREELNSFDQSVSRISFVSLLGLPITFGDDLPSLPPSHLDLLKRSLPILDIHPMSFSIPNRTDSIEIVNLSLCMSYEDYTVADVLNLSDATVKRYLDFQKDLHLENDRYLVYDYHQNAFMGSFTDGVFLSLKPHQSKVLCIRKCQNRPQILSSSRHITQGAQEITAFAYQNNRMEFTSSLIQNDPYTVTIYLPENYRFQSASGGTATQDGQLLKLSVLPEETGDYSFSIEFEER